MRLEARIQLFVIGQWFHWQSPSYRNPGAFLQNFLSNFDHIFKVFDHWSTAV